MVEKKSAAKKNKKSKAINTVGKRKRAVARATFKPGRGVIKINRVPLDLINNEVVRMKISEPLALAGDGWKRYDIMLNVQGGGHMGQADASRQAIAKGIVKLIGGDIKKRYLEYDKYMLVADSRRTEPHKPPRSSQGPRRAKQKSKR